MYGVLGDNYVIAIIMSEVFKLGCSSCKPFILVSTKGFIIVGVICSSYNMSKVFSLFALLRRYLVLHITCNSLMK